MVTITVHLSSDFQDNGPMTYWLVVAAIAAFVAYGRFVIEPI